VVEGIVANKSENFPPRGSISVIDKSGAILVRCPNREREGTKLRRYPQLLTATGGTCITSMVISSAPRRSFLDTDKGGVAERSQRPPAVIADADKPSVHQPRRGVDHGGPDRSSTVQLVFRGGSGRQLPVLRACITRAIWNRFSATKNRFHPTTFSSGSG
jgi:hypothetical protein